MAASHPTADLVAIGRGLIADPDWPEKVRTGRTDEITPCIACNACVDLISNAHEAGTLVFRIRWPWR